MLDRTDTHVVVNGAVYTPEEARALAERIRAASDEIDHAAYLRKMEERKAAERAAILAELTAQGATHIETFDEGAWRWRAKDGTPWRRDRWGRTEMAYGAWQVGPGPELEGRVPGGRKWRSLEEIGDLFVGSWRVKEVRDGG